MTLLCNKQDSGWDHQDLPSLSGPIMRSLVWSKHRERAMRGSKNGSPVSVWSWEGVITWNKLLCKQATEQIMGDLKSKARTKPQYFGVKVGRAVALPVSLQLHNSQDTHTRGYYFNTFNSALWLTCTEIILLKKIKHFHLRNTKLNMYNKIKQYDTKQTYIWGINILALN